MMAEYDLSACIVLYHTPMSDLQQVMACLKQSSVPADIYLVNNGPEDETAATIRKNYPDVTFLQQDENLGFGKGNQLFHISKFGNAKVIKKRKTKRFPFLNSVGVIRLERTTPCTPCKCAKPTAPHPELLRLQKYTFFYLLVRGLEFFLKHVFMTLRTDLLFCILLTIFAFFLVKTSCLP